MMRSVLAGGVITGAIVFVVLCGLGCGGHGAATVNSASPTAAATLKTYSSAPFGFVLTYDASRLAVLKSPGPQRLAFRFVAKGATLRGLVGVFGFGDRDRKDTFDGASGGLSITVMRAETAFRLPSLSTFRQAPRLLLNVGYPSYFAIGDQGSRTVAPVVLRGIAGYRIDLVLDNARERYYVLARGKSLYVVSCFAAVRLWSAIEPTFMSVVRSLQVSQ